MPCGAESNVAPALEWFSVEWTGYLRALLTTRSNTVSMQMENSFENSFVMFEEDEPLKQKGNNILYCPLLNSFFFLTTTVLPGFLSVGVCIIRDKVG